MLVTMRLLCGGLRRLDAEVLEMFDPLLAVASAGEGNGSGHPTPECVEVLEGTGSLYLCTNDAGDETVEPGTEGPVVIRQKGWEP